MHRNWIFLDAILTLGIWFCSSCLYYLNKSFFEISIATIYFIILIINKLLIIYFIFISKWSLKVKLVHFLYTLMIIVLILLLLNLLSEVFPLDLSTSQSLNRVDFV